MARNPRQPLTARIVIHTPAPGVALSLQDKSGGLIDIRRPDGTSPVVFAFPVEATAAGRFYGTHVRSEGPTRQFAYVCVGEAAGDPGSCWNRRMKVDLPVARSALLLEAGPGGVIEVEVSGVGADGTPACATVPALRD